MSKLDTNLLSNLSYFKSRFNYNKTLYQYRQTLGSSITLNIEYTSIMLNSGALWYERWTAVKVDQKSSGYLGKG